MATSHDDMTEVGLRLARTLAIRVSERGLIEKTGRNVTGEQVKAVLMEDLGWVDEEDLRSHGSDEEVVRLINEINKPLTIPDESEYDITVAIRKGQDWTSTSSSRTVTRTGDRLPDRLPPLVKKPRIESPYREVVELVRDAFCGSDRVDVTEASQSMVLMQLKALKHPDPYIRHIIRDLASSVQSNQRCGPLNLLLGHLRLVHTLTAKVVQVEKDCADAAWKCFIAICTSLCVSQSVLVESTVAEQFHLRGGAAMLLHFILSKKLASQRLTDLYLSGIAQVLLSALRGLATSDLSDSKVVLQRMGVCYGSMEFLMTCGLTLDPGAIGLVEKVLRRLDGADPELAQAAFVLRYEVAWRTQAPFGKRKLPVPAVPSRMASTNPGEVLI
ncbi:hypothetical protein Pmar_PMAR012668 [Perkinsus marinus ATCC 50983]|uniref:Uncharacterized protein n=1 Tax=Perkinsus marinus (strain ATCC 50983 / TXsc) TaxID=423536 RepID=C5K7Z5_PERM5|nr:hypothetical protein Pmar_PMAR012668 [Perkinsus marinus ATCC 50983]EER19680.1 hypothetical protein Pmar_PMAR012668 [Perkinsus marinus ATCC 50983]|eukprot:XP_002787884.1 hypothetical protein Pmar_PMAR012668 [Perkinsus marinus ATCC 50983]